MPPSPKPHIKCIRPSFHGGAAFFNRLPGDREINELLDFSTCCNPYGTPANVRAKMRSIDASHYPDPNSTRLLQALSDRSGVSPDNLIGGSGSTELIRMAAQSYLGEGDTAIIPTPTYGEYELACTIVNAGVVKYGTEEKCNFRLDCDAFISFARPLDPAAIFLCNPNNPTGQYLEQDEIKSILRSFPDALVVLDEAYIAFTDRAWDSRSLIASKNLLILRSMTKDFALAGLRLGYAMAYPEIIENLKKVRPPWNVSSAAQSAGLAALSSDGYLARCTQRITRSRAYLTRELDSLGYKVVPTRTNFFIFKTAGAVEFQKKLLAKGILVRDCSSFGLPQYVRMAPLARNKCKNLVDAIKEIGAEVL